MRRRALAVTTALICSTIVIPNTVLPQSGALDDRNAGGKAVDAGLFGLTRVVPLHIEIPADEYQAMQPPVPAGVPGGPPPAAQPKKPGGRASERNLFGLEFPWGCARGRHGRGQDTPGRRTPVRRERFLHGLRRGPEAILRRRPRQRRSRGVPRPAWHAAPGRRARPHEGARGPRLRPLPRGRSPRAAHGDGRGDAHRPRRASEGVSRTLHPRRARGPGVPEGPLRHRQGPAPEAAGAPRTRLPRRGLGEIPRTLPTPGRADPRRGEALDRVPPPGPAGR